MRGRACVTTLLALIAATCSPVPTRAGDPVADVKAIWEMQAAAWNRGDLEAFMAGYWKSPDLVFFTNSRARSISRSSSSSRSEVNRCSRAGAGVPDGWRIVHDHSSN